MPLFRKIEAAGDTVPTNRKASRNRVSSSRRTGNTLLAGHRASAVVGLVVAFGWTYLLLGRSHDLANIHNDVVTIVAEWAVVVFLVVIAFGIQKRTLADFGLRAFGWRELLMMLGALIGSYVVVGVISRFVSMPTSSLGVRNLVSVPWSIKIGLVFTAAICEEFMYRGFGIEELAGLTGSLWLAGLLSWLAFSMAHVDRYGLNMSLIIPAVVGAFLTLLYLWRRNLPVCMFLHGTIDGLSILLVPLLLTSHMK